MEKLGLGGRRGTTAARSLTSAAALTFAMLAQTVLPSLAGAAPVSVSGTPAAWAGVSIGARTQSRGTKFSLRAGESKVIDVKISRNGRRRVMREKARYRIAAAAATTTQDGDVKAPDDADRHAGD